MSATQVVLWRHGRTGHNAASRWQGQLDVALDEVGAEQARAAAEVLAGRRPGRLVSSDLSRARDTAAELAALTGLLIETDTALREVDGGEWQGLTGVEIEQRWPLEYAAWRRGEDVVIGGRERRSDVGQRVWTAIEGYAAATDGVLVVVSHGMALRTALLRLLGLPVEAWTAVGPLGNARWASVDRGRSGWLLTEFNVGALSPGGGRAR